MARKSKKHRHKADKRQKQSQQEEAKATSEEPQLQKGGWKSLDKTFKQQLIIIFLLGFGLYVNTVPFEYALDDKIAITHNEFTKEGISGIDDLLSNDAFVGFYGRQKDLVAGGRYRPLSMVTFAIEWELFGKSPHVSHFINTLLYAFTGVLLFIILLKLFPPEKEKKWYLTFPFIAAVLYVTHPIHTEAVANIKGRDEIMSLLGALGALYYTLQYISKNHKKYLLYSAIVFFLGLLSKEITITFLAVIPLTIHFFTKKTIKENIMVSMPIILATVVYLGVRFSVIGGIKSSPVTELMNNPFVHATAGEKFATIFYTMGLYIQLLFFPHPLSHDYYPKQVPIIDWGDMRAIIPLLIYAGLIIYALYGLKKKSVIAYGIWIYLATFSIASNIVFPIGTFMNERFMYFPSIGFCIILAWVLAYHLPQWIKKAATYKNVATVLLLGISLAYSIKTISRNTAWKNDYTLSTTDVKNSPNSAKVNMAAGGSMVEEAKKQSDPAKKQQMVQQAIRYLNKALEIYPGYSQPLDLLGIAYYEAGDYAKSIHYFDLFLQSGPAQNHRKRVIKNLKILSRTCLEKNLVQLAEKANKTILNYQEDVDAYASLGEIYGKYKQNLPQALKYLNKASELAPANTNVLQKLGIVYAMSGQAQKAIETFQKGLQVEPENAHLLLNLGITLKNTGQEAKGQQYIQKAHQINPELKNG